MQHYVGLDVSVNETSVCIVDKAGKVIREVKVATEPVAILAVLTEDLRNVAANYPFVRAHRFPGIQPNSAHRDCSRLSCAAGEMPLGPRAAGSSASISHRAAIAVRHKLPRFLPIQRCSAGGQTSNTIAHFALDFERKESVCGVHGHRA
jgi:hypothetical protein